MTLGMGSVILLGFWIMKRLDTALFEQADFACAGNESGKKAKVLIFVDDNGGDFEAEIHALMHELTVSGVPYERTTNPGYQKLETFSCVLALSSKDLDNVLLCHQAKRLRPEIGTIARCSRNVYREIFHDQGVDRIISNLPGSAVLKALFELYEPKYN
ncbi:TrkA-N domain-containing protein [Acidaminobacter hydrogenoformans DSM 2784]|uniref:TrkA-N domain-containing protein n=1 Tax=Acidaminobacter hydrogenoformans DSM 2784 TaxID=1120920 RepID=A0A1G5S7C4_9FIRM|nr:TrkA-N domain-containing protein [Acidaminobacter hydrogenoformans DSM 2784]